MKMNISQMELGLNGKRACLTPKQRSRRRQRTQWWFSHMRRVVSATLEWQPDQSAQPEQICLGFTARRS